MIAVVTDLGDGVTAEQTGVTVTVVDGGVGANGASAYDIAVANGFSGTEAEWLTSLHGEDGAGVVATVVAPLVLTGDELSFDDTGYVASGDSRLTDSRTPTAHATSHQDGGTDELALDGSQITAGTIVDARIASTIARDTEVTAAVASEATARDTAIALAIADLIASAPGVLDTLDEIAAALGDDPNFAATITTALAGKQPIDSDLTAIAALTTTSIGRSLLAGADAAALRTILALATVASSGSAADLTGTLAIARIADGTVTRAKADPDLSSQIPVLSEATADYTAVLTDAGSFKPLNKATAIVWTIPPNSGVAFPVGTVLEAYQKGAGQVTITPGSGVTINSPAGLKSRAQHSQFSVRKVATDTWQAAGDTTT